MFQSNIQFIFRLLIFDNKLNEDGFIFVGQEIKITTKNNKVHVVKDGDTLWSIAEEYLGDGSRYTEIFELNGLDSKDLWLGQELTIPE